MPSIEELPAAPQAAFLQQRRLGVGRFQTAKVFQLNLVSWKGNMGVGRFQTAKVFQHISTESTCPSRCWSLSNSEGVSAKGKNAIADAMWGVGRFQTAKVFQRGQP